MKTAGALFVCLALVTTLAHASRIDTYDPDTGFYYRSIDVKSDSGGLMSKGPVRHAVNINIFDPATAQNRLLFPRSESRRITVFLYEEAREEDTIRFVRFSIDSQFSIKNNQRVEPRPIKNKLLVGVWDPKTQDVTLYVASKSGDDLRELTVVPAGVTFHLDVRNSKLRVVRLFGDSVAIKSFDW